MVQPNLSMNDDTRQPLSKNAPDPTTKGASPAKRDRAVALDVEWEDLPLDIDIEDELDDIPDDEELIGFELDDALRSIEAGRFEIDDFLLPEDPDDSLGNTKVKSPTKDRYTSSLSMDGSDDELDDLDEDDDDVAVDDDGVFLASIEDDDLMLDVLSADDLGYDDISIPEKPNDILARKNGKSKKAKGVATSLVLPSPRNSDLDLINDSLMELDLDDRLDMKSPLVIDGIELDRQVRY